MSNDPSAIIKETQTHTVQNEVLIALLSLEVEYSGQIAVPICHPLIHLGDHTLNFGPGGLHCFGGVNSVEDGLRDLG